MSLWQRHWTLLRCSGCRNTERMTLDVKRQTLTCQRCGMVYEIDKLHHPPPGSTASESLPPTPTDPQREGSESDGLGPNRRE